MRVPAYICVHTSETEEENFGKKGGKKEKREETCAHCAYLFTCMHSRGAVAQSIIGVLSTPTEERNTVQENCG